MHVVINFGCTLAPRFLPSVKYLKGLVTQPFLGRFPPFFGHLGGNKKKRPENAQKRHKNGLKTVQKRLCNSALKQRGKKTAVKY